MSASRSLRPVDVVRLGAGVVALARPQWLVAATGSADGPWVCRVVRVLGVRYLVQSAAGLTGRRPWVPQADAAVDLVHAVSMLGVARVFPGHRRLALVSAGVAVGFAVADVTGGVR